MSRMAVAWPPLAVLILATLIVMAHILALVSGKCDMQSEETGLHLDAWSGSHMDYFSLSNACSFARDVVANEVWSYPRNFLGPFRGLVPSSSASTAWFSHDYK